MAPRVLAVLGALVVPALASWIGDRLQPAWLPGLAAGLVLAIAAFRPRGFFSLAIAAGLSALASDAAADGGMLWRARDEASWPRHDLARAGLPEDATGFWVIRGHLRHEWVLAEYRVAAGERPDQNEQAPAVLVPLLGSTADVVAAEQRVVVARIPGGETASRGPVELGGRLSPLAPELLDALVVRGGGLSGAALSGVLLDATDRPTPARIWTRVGLSAVGSAIALVLCWLSLTDRAARRRAGDM